MALEVTAERTGDALVVITIHSVTTEREVECNLRYRIIDFCKQNLIRLRDTVLIQTTKEQVLKREILRSVISSTFWNENNENYDYSKYGFGEDYLGLPGYFAISYALLGSQYQSGDIVDRTGTVVSWQEARQHSKSTQE